MKNAVKRLASGVCLCWLGMLATGSTDASATPGLVFGEVTNSIYLTVGANPALAVNLMLPRFHLTYISTGVVHEDGGSTSFVYPVSEILIGMDIYAYAFSEPFLPGVRVSETLAHGWFDDGVFGTVTNTSAAIQPLELSIYSRGGLDFYTSQPNDLASGSAGGRLTGSIDFWPGADLRDGITMLSLAPGSSYHFRIDDFHASLLLRAAGVPEPASWSMMIIGLGTAGLALRRQRQTMRTDGTGMGNLALPSD